MAATYVRTNQGTFKVCIGVCASGMGSKKIKIKWAREREGGYCGKGIVVARSILDEDF